LYIKPALQANCLLNKSVMKNCIWLYILAVVFYLSLVSCKGKTHNSTNTADTETKGKIVPDTGKNDSLNTDTIVQKKMK